MIAIKLGQTLSHARIFMHEHRKYDILLIPIAFILSLCLLGLWFSVVTFPLGLITAPMWAAMAITSRNKYIAGTFVVVTSIYLFQ